MTVREFLQGRFMRHPLHPMIVHIPVGLWIASFAFDVGYMATESSGVAAASFYCIIGGIIGALLAVPTGVAEYIDIPQHTHAKRLATSHMLLNVVVLVLYALNFLSRFGPVEAAPNVVTGGQLVLNLVSVGLLSASGYLGGRLVYEHGIGFRGEEVGVGAKVEAEPRKQRPAA